MPFLTWRAERYVRHGEFRWKRRFNKINEQLMAMEDMIADYLGVYLEVRRWGCYRRILISSADGGVA